MLATTNRLAVDAEVKSVHYLGFHFCDEIYALWRIKINYSR